MIEVNYIDHMGSDLSVVNAARVSFGKQSEWTYPTERKSEQPKGVYPSSNMSGSWVDVGKTKRVLSDKDTKLIYYLAKHKHTSPFGHAFATFHVKAPIFVARQLVKHKFLRWNEISRRYVDSEPEFYVPDVWRGRSEDKKQGSEGVVTNVPIVAEENALQNYTLLLNQGVCPEQARMVLPQSMMTEWYWSGSLDAWSDMCLLRCASDTQAETQKVAGEISLKMHELFPISWMALGTGRDG